MSSQRAEQLASIAMVAILYLAWFGFKIGGYRYGLDPWLVQVTVDQP